MKIVFWSQTGNTEAMAEAVAEGVKAAGKDAEAVSVSDISAADLAGEEVFALGCPAMGDEVLDEGEMEPFVEELIPETAEGEHSNWGVLSFAVGFTIMMALDVALG